MRCRRAFEADLPAVLHGESRDGEFLAHYPSCPECATEVGIWRELDGLLRTGTTASGNVHPEPEMLVAFADATLADEARADVTHHLATCRVCADELKALAAFDPKPLTAAARRAPAPQPGRSTVARVVWHPAFAYALVVVLLVPIVRDRWPQMVMPVREERVSEPPQAPPAEHDVAARSLPETLRAAPPAELRRVPAPEKNVANRAAAREAFTPPEAAAPPANAVAPLPGAEALARPDARAFGAARKDAAPLAKRGPAPEPEARRQGTVTVGERTEDDAGSEGVPALADAGVPRRESADAGRARAPTDPDRDSSARRTGAAGDAPEYAAAAQPPAAIVAGGTGGPIFEVRPEAPPVIPFAIAEGGVRLRLVPPKDFVVGALDVHARGVVRGPSISLRVTDRADAIEVRIPPRWLVTGEYEVTLTSVADMERSRGTSNTAAILRFSVRAPAPDGRP